MTGMGMEMLAQSVVGRVVNTLPEGLLLVVAAWILLRLLRKQNAGTRFAVWLVALVGVAGLPLLSGVAVGGQRLGAVGHAEVTISARWAIAIVALWVPIALAALARVLAGVWQVRAIRKSCDQVDVNALDAAMRAAIEQAQLSASRGRHVALLTSDTARVPAAIGFRHPAIVLPAWCLREMRPEELQPILIHEMEHLRRRDDWTNLLQKIVRAMLFFHPAVWWIDARLAEEREMACDDAVLAHTQDARQYAGSLIGLLEHNCARRGWTMAQAAVAKARDASARIARILSGGAVATTRLGRGAMGWIAALCLACCGLLGVMPQLVGFGPDASVTQAQGAGGDRVISTDLRTSAGARVTAVPAMYRPAQAQPHRMNAVLLTRKNSDKQAAPSASGIAVASNDKPRTAAPKLMMAKLDATKMHSGRREMNTPMPAVRMVMVVETAETYPQADAAVPAMGDGDMRAVPAQAASFVQVRTVQVLEKNETGWHLHAYRLVEVVPVDELLDLKSSI
jgi:beta-lactamase regulating signal transducer with metallopeptidase domain